MASRRLDDLAQPVMQAAQGLKDAARAVGLEVLVYCTLRSEAEQATLYASGRTVPGRILTNSKPGQSLHNPDENGKAWAFDAVPVLNGVALWGDEKRIKQMGLLGEEQGLEWAGRWRGDFRESVHFQMKRK